MFLLNGKSYIMHTRPRSLANTFCCWQKDFLLPLVASNKAAKHLWSGTATSAQNRTQTSSSPALNTNLVLICMSHACSFNSSSIIRWSQALVWCYNLAASVMGANGFLSDCLSTWTAVHPDDFWNTVCSFSQVKYTDRVYDGLQQCGK